MATVPTQDRLTLTQPKYGITVGIYPSSNPSFDVELQRGISTSATPSLVAPTSSRFSQIAVLGVINGGARVDYQDGLPQSNQFYWYRARSIRDGWTPSAFTTAVNAQSGIIPASIPGAIPFSGRPINVGVRLSTAATPAYGTTGVPAYFTKTRRVLPTEWRGETSTVTYTVQGGWLAPLTTRPSAYDVDLLLPIGAIVTGVTWRLHRNSTKATAKVELWFGKSSDFGSTQVISKTSTGVGDFTFSQSGLNLTFSTGRWLFSRATLTSTNAGGATQTRLLYLDVTYKINTLAQSI